MPNLHRRRWALITWLIAGARSWSRRLCAMNLCLTGLFLLLAAAAFAQGYAATAGFRQEAGMIGAFILFGSIPVAVEFFVLLALARWRVRAPSRPC